MRTRFPLFVCEANNPFVSSTERKLQIMIFQEIPDVSEI